MQEKTNLLTKIIPELMNRTILLFEKLLKEREK